LLLAIEDTKRDDVFADDFLTDDATAAFEEDVDRDDK